MTDNSSTVIRISLSVKEAALASGLSERTIWTRIRCGALRAAHVGGRVLVLQSDLTAWLESLADSSGSRVRPDLAAPLAARNRARAVRAAA